jgi:hypothetical protein
MTTMQNVGAAMGVAITGVIFFGALHGGYAHALELSLAQLAGLLLAVAALTRLLPAPERAVRASDPAACGVVNVPREAPGMPDGTFAPWEGANVLRRSGGA